MDAVVHVTDVRRVETRSGKARWVLVDDAGKEASTFRPRIGEEAERHAGRRVRIEFHEEDRDGFHNVYLDGIEAAPGAAEAPSAGDARDSDPDEVAWGTAVEPAPWLPRHGKPEKETPADELYEKARAVQAARRRGHPPRRDGGED